MHSTFVDLDLHRYMCSKCGDVGYYSGAAATHFKTGHLFDVEGLDGPIGENMNERITLSDGSYIKKLHRDRYWLFLQMEN